MDIYDAILVPGGGVREEGELPLWTKRRLDRAIEKRHGAYVLALSAGTTHRPPPLDADGYPIFESVAAANYLIERGVDPDKVLVETSSYDTIGNVFFSRVIHIEPLNIRRLLVITSDFHMPRARAIFEWIYRLEGLPQDYQIAFDAVSDEGIDQATLESRRRREMNSLEKLAATANTIHTLRDFHRWLFSKHGAYAMSTPVVQASGKTLETY